MKMFMFALYEVISTVSNTNEGKIYIFLCIPTSGNLQLF